MGDRFVTVQADQERCLSRGKRCHQFTCLHGGNSYKSEFLCLLIILIQGLQEGSQRSDIVLSQRNPSKLCGPIAERSFTCEV